MKTIQRTFIFIVSSLIVLSILSTIVYAKPKKNKNKNHPSNKQQVVVIKKEVVRKQSVPSNINTWTSVNAPIYTASCPFSCATEGINKGHCRDWRNGNTCFVQDTSLNTYDYAADRYIVIPGESPGQVVGRKIDQAVTNILR